MDRPRDRLPVELGARARAAAEQLLHARQPQLMGVDAEAAYWAGCCVVMRLVVVLLAESRGLLPVDSELYRQEYALGSLLTSLARARATQRQQRTAAWPRLLALFQLVHAGSSLPQLTLPAYGGSLFRAGDASGDPRQRALAAVETAAAPLDDEQVYGLLMLLTRTRTAATDFAALPSEYIGVYYEGLLDRRGRTRKGAGTFYTCAELSLPAVRRTLEPLLHDQDGRLRPPQDLLSLTICDPAMGCGAFVLAALRVLSEAVLAAQAVHGCDPAGERDLAQIRLAVATRCLYGVELDPLATELARTALWLELAEPRLPLTFVDHKLRCGDALVGAWRQNMPAELPTATSADALRQAYDTFCARWFWPRDQRPIAPRPQQLDALSPPARAVVQQLAAERRFFHWELEFPQVFAAPSSGFDAVITNPPWEIRKPSSKEFFSELDPRYRSYSKQEALTRQRQLFAATPQAEAAWLSYIDTFGATARFVRHAFRHQGVADLNSYKLFVEQAYVLVRPGGQLGLITPSGLYTDQGTLALRRLLLSHCNFRILYGFQNEKRIFRAVHHAFKQCLIIAEKAGTTESLEVMFRLGVAESPAAADIAHQLGAGWSPVRYSRAIAESFSPRSLSILEIRSPRDLQILSKIQAASVLLGEPGPGGFGIKYSSEFHMTTDSKLFVPRDQAEREGYRADAYGRWCGPRGELLLPLYQGIMFYGLCPNVARHESGAGHKARWSALFEPAAPLQPQFLIPAAAYAKLGPRSSLSKVAFRTLSNATNERTMVACLLDDVPCGNSVGLLSVGQGRLAEHALATACLGSLIYDWTLRQRIAGTNINFCFLQETGWPADSLRWAPRLCGAVLALCAPAWRYAPLWLEAQGSVAGVRWAATPHERLRLRCVLDAAVAALYGLAMEELQWILRDCELPKERLANPTFCRTLDPKGFWRIDRDKDPELRHPVLTLRAFAALQQRIREHGGERDAGLAAFLADGQGQDDPGWMLPEPAASRLGPRLLGWQLAQTAEQSWAECESHARARLGSAPQRFTPAQTPR